MTEQKKIVYGILGTAWIATVNIPAIRYTGGVVRAIASRNLERAQEFATKHEIEIAYGSYDDLLQDKEIDVVFIPLPTMLHAEWTIKAAKAGKHVLCEKPLAPTLDDVKTMLSVCAENKVLFVDGLMWQHQERSKRIKQEIEDGAIGGPVKRISSVFNWKNNDKTNIRMKVDAEPLGALGDLGYYNIRSILFGFDFDMPTKVFGDAQYNEDGVLMTFVGVLWFSGGRVGQFSCSFETAEHQTFSLHGPLGVITVPDFVFPFEKALTYIVDEPLGKQRVETTKYDDKWVHSVPLFETMSGLVRDGKIVSDWSTFSLQTMTVLDALLRASKEGKPIEL